MSSDTNKKPLRKEERLRKAIRSLDQGEGVEVFISSHKNDKDEKGSITEYFSNKQEKIADPTDIFERELEVEFSSDEQENKELLHHLSRKAR